MIAASSRFVTIGRTVMPYATWAAYVIQLGYLGYNLYQYYQDYLAQVRRDQRSNTRRGLDETIELVVARRRRRLDRQLGDQQQQQQDQEQQTTTIQEQTDQQQQSQESSTGDQATTTLTRQQPTASTSTAAAVDVIEISNDSVAINNTSNQTIIIDDDDDDNDDNSSDQENSAKLAEQIDGQNRRRSKVDPFVRTANNVSSDSYRNIDGTNKYHDENDSDNDEILSDTSLSLESTDSNCGIIKDMYNECFICARTLNDPNKQVATLPFCMHPFHKTCLDGVLKWHRKCPVCDFDIFSPI